MTLVRPFTALRPVASRAQEVLAPPYDVLNSEEARAQVSDRPLSFLFVSKPEVSLPTGVDHYSDEVYQQGAINLQKLIRLGVLQRDPLPFYYVYRLTMGERSQTGLVAAASVDAYQKNLIRKHEYTRPDKENDRVRHIDALNAQTGPVFLVYRAEQQLDELLQQITSGDKETDVTLESGVRHELWLERDPDRIARITELVEARGVLYIADGHHRSAAASRVAQKRAEAQPGSSGEESWNYFLTVTFSHKEVEILDYNRVVRHLNGMSPEAFLEKVADNFVVTPESNPVKPQAATTFGLYLAGSWYALAAKERIRSSNDPVKSLDVSILHDHLIEPLLGIADPRTDKDIDFVGGIRGLAELEKRVDSGEMRVAFSLYPTSLEALMAVADAGQVMPPKSTWFEPKLADGMASLVLD